MSNLGLGVMINMLKGNEETVNSYHAAVGKVIKKAELTDSDHLVLTFEDYSELDIYDDGQSCCEHRYMRTDDDLNDLVGCKLLGLELKEAPTVMDDWSEHEIQFLEVKTDKGCVTMASHNEHNGYYGGFSIELRYKEKQA